MVIQDDPRAPDGPVQLLSFCHKHCTPAPHLSGTRSALLCPPPACHP